MLNKIVLVPVSDCRSYKIATRLGIKYTTLVPSEQSTHFFDYLLEQTRDKDYLVINIDSFIYGSIENSRSHF